MSRSLISVIGVALILALAFTSCTSRRGTINGGDGDYFYGPNRH